MNIYNINNSELVDIDWPDVYFTPQYGRLVEISDSGVWECAIWANRIIYVYIKRPITYNKLLCHDLVSPYGYSGIWIDDTVLASDFNKFWEEFNNYAAKNNYVCQYIRFNPYIMTSDRLSKVNISKQSNKITFGIKLDHNDYFKSAKKSHKYAVKKATRDGYKTVIKDIVYDDIKRGSPFRKLYDSTMDACGSSPYYYFSDEYFTQLLNISRVIIANALDKTGEIIGSALFFKYKNMLNYHLSSKKMGSKNVSDFILHSMTKWGEDNGVTFFHLGGGITNNDSLSRFKSSMANCSFDYYYGTHILNEPVYSELAKLKAQEKNITIEQLETYNYFPIYRAN